MKQIETPKSLVEQTYDILEDAICIGRLQPGERLTQDAIAARLNVSRQPVNAALGLLKANHLVRDTGRRGVIVAPLDPELYRSIYEFRGVVEPMAAELAARRGVSADDRAEGEAIIAAGWQARRAGDVAGMTRADVDFHGWVYRLSGNRVIAETMRLYWVHIRRTMSAILQSHEDYPSSIWEQHAAIFVAIVEGRAEEAATLMRGHLLGSFARVEAPLRAAAAG